MSCEWEDRIEKDRKCTITDLPCTVEKGETCDLAYAISDKLAEHYNS